MEDEMASDLLRFDKVTGKLFLKGANGEQQFFFSSRRRHTIFKCDWSSDVCSSDLRADLSAFAGYSAIPINLLNRIIGLCRLFRYPDLLVNLHNRTLTWQRATTQNRPSRNCAGVHLNRFS